MANFLFAANDVFNSFRYSFAEQELKKMGKGDFVPSIHKQNAFLITEGGTGYSLHSDAQRNTHSLEDGKVVPRSRNGVAVNTMVFTCDLQNEFGAIEGHSGTLETGEKEENNFVKGGSLKTFDGSIHHQATQSQREGLAHCAKVVPNKLARLVCSFRSLVEGKDKTLARYDNDESVTELVQDALDRRMSFHKLLITSAQARSLAKEGSEAVNSSLTATAPSHAKQTRKKRKLPFRVETKYPKEAYMPRAYARQTKVASFSGPIWPYFTAHQESMKELIEKKGAGGFRVILDDGTKHFVGVPHFQGEYMRRGKLYPTKYVNEFHHMSSEGYEGKGKHKRPGKQIWTANTNIPFTAVLLIQKYKRCPGLDKEVLDPDDDMYFFASGGNGRASDVFGSDFKGEAEWIGSSNQDPINNPKNKAALNAWTNQECIICLYTADSEKSDHCRYHGLIVPDTLYIGRLDEKGVKAEMFAKGVTDNILKYLDYLNHKVIMFKFKFLQYDEAKLLAHFSAGGEAGPPSAESSAKYFSLDGTSMAGENLKIALPSNQFVEGTRPYKKDGMVVNDAITGRQEARRRFRDVLEKKKDTSVFMQQWDCEDFTVWNGATAQAEDEDSDGEAEDEDSDGEIEEGNTADNENHEEECSNSADTAVNLSMIRHPTIESVVDHIVCVEGASIARALGEGHIVRGTGGNPVPWTLHPRKFAFYGTVCRMHPLLSPLRMENPTCQRFTRIVRAWALEKFGGKLSEDSGLAHFAEMRTMFDRAWCKSNIEDFLAIQYTAALNQLMSTSDVWTYWMCYQDSELDKCVQKRSSETVWGKCLVQLNEADNFASFIGKLLESDKYNCTVYHLKSGQYQLPVTERQQILAIIKRLPQLLRDATMKCMVTDKNGRWDYIAGVSEQVGEASGNNATAAQKRNWMFFTSQFLNDVEECTVSPLGECTWENTFLGYGSRKGLKWLADELNNVTGDGSWTIEKAKLALHYSSKKRATEDENYRGSLGLELHEGTLVHGCNKRPFEPKDGENIDCEVPYRAMQKTFPSRSKSKLPTLYKHYTWPIFFTLEGFTPMSEQDKVRAEKRYRYMNSVIKSRPAKAFCFEEEDGDRHSDVYDSEREEYLPEQGSWTESKKVQENASKTASKPQKRKGKAAKPPFSRKKVRAERPPLPVEHPTRQSTRKRARVDYYAEFTQEDKAPEDELD